jgi:hypothetical protein
MLKLSKDFIFLLIAFAAALIAFMDINSAYLWGYSYILDPENIVVIIALGLITFITYIFGEVINNYLIKIGAI